jgi:hypothetical protein
MSAPTTATNHAAREISTRPRCHRGQGQVTLEVGHWNGREKGGFAVEGVGLVHAWVAW